jgi:ABC-type lipoprotein export system ATPase subunit
MPDAAVVERVSKHFNTGRRVEALVDVDLTVNEAELVVLLGRSGAGKSTLLSLIGGLDSPDAGTIRVGGREVSSLHGDEMDRFRQRTIGWAFQTAGLLPLLTALENVWLPLALLGQDEKTAISEARSRCPGARPGQSALAPPGRRADRAAGFGDRSRDHRVDTPGRRLGHGRALRNA